MLGGLRKNLLIVVCMQKYAKQVGECSVTHFAMLFTWLSFQVHKLKSDGKTCKYYLSAVLCIKIAPIIK